MKHDTALSLARVVTDPEISVGITVACGYVALVAMYLAGWLS